MQSDRESFFPADFVVAYLIKFSRKLADEISKDTAQDAGIHFQGR